MNNINTNVYLKRTIKNSTRICALIVLLLQVFYGQNLKAQTCPTCTDMQTTIIDVDALPLSSDKKPLTFTGPIDKDSCKDPNVSGLKCFAFKFVRASGSTNQEFTFSAGQGASCNGELDKAYIMSGSTCTTLSSGGSQTTITFAFPEGVNEATLFLCINSNSSVCLKDVCRPASNKKPKIDSPNDDAYLGCNPIIVAPVFTLSGQCNTNTNIIVTTTGAEGTGCMKSQTWKANFTDECNNVAKEKVITYTWTEDTTPPVIECPENITLDAVQDDCKITGTFEINVTDNCTSASQIVVTYTLSGATTSMANEFTSLNGVVFNQGITYITVTATDKCGNVSMAPCEFELSCEGVTVQPVTLISFDGKVTKEGNELNWKSTDEVNFSHYEVERSSNAKAFEFISKVNGSSNSKEIKSFNYLDNKSVSNNYYRLKMIDIDGEFEYSKVIFLNSENNKLMVGEFYPNPATESQSKININSDETTNWTITSFDIRGKVLKTETRLLQKGANEISILAAKEDNIQFFRFESSGIIQYRKLLK